MNGIAETVFINQPTVTKIAMCTNSGSTFPRKNAEIAGLKTANNVKDGMATKITILLAEVYIFPS